MSKHDNQILLQKTCCLLATNRALPEHPVGLNSEPSTQKCSYYMGFWNGRVIEQWSRSRASRQRMIVRPKTVSGGKVGCAGEGPDCYSSDE